MIELFPSVTFSAERRGYNFNISNRIHSVFPPFFFLVYSSTNWLPSGCGDNHGGRCRKSCRVPRTDTELGLAQPSVNDVHSGGSKVVGDPGGSGEKRHE